MSTVKVVMVRCDGVDVAGGSRDLQPTAVAPFFRCEERFVGDESEPEGFVLRRAKTAGWVRKDGARDYCPRHAQQGVA